MLPIVTIASKNYLAQVRTLAESYLRLHADGEVFFCLVDQVDGYFDPEHEPFTTIFAESLNISNWQQFAFKYTILELNTAVKPYLLSYLFEHYQLDKLVYFDPDIVLYNSLDTLEALLDTYGIVLTPHILEPINDSAAPSEIDLLQAGTYNLGFVALSRRTNLRPLLKWWESRLYNQCIRDVEHGLFVDQRWMDLAPAMFRNVYIWQHPGCNVAYWNFAHRAVQGKGNTFLVNGEPLMFMHYSGLVVENLESVSKHQNRFTLGDLSTGTQYLIKDYRDKLLANDYTTVKTWPYVYGKFTNGISIPDIARAICRKLDWLDPFKTGPGSFFEYLNSPAEGVSAAPYLTQLAAAVYRENTNLQRYLPEGLTQQRTRLMHWFYTEGYLYYQLDDAFLEPMRPKSTLEIMATVVQQQQELGGTARKMRLKHVAKTVLGMPVYERLRAIYRGFIGSRA